VADLAGVRASVRNDGSQPDLAAEMHREEPSFDPLSALQAWYLKSLFPPTPAVTSRLSPVVYCPKVQSRRAEERRLPERITMASPVSKCGGNVIDETVAEDVKLADLGYEQGMGKCYDIAQ
jgi:hypothetical protein